MWTESVQNDWTAFLTEEMQKPYFRKLRMALEEDDQQHTVYPPKTQIFHAFRLTPYAKVKAVILGQDPYHGEGQAHGLSFSVPPGVALPPSLRNIFKELQADIRCEIPVAGDLTGWAKQGVLLLNTVLTVRAHTPNSHKGIGWETFTDRVIAVLNERKQPLVFVLWGKHAQEKRALITAKQHLVLESAHPSPLAARKGFFGSRPFSRINQFLRENGQERIDWERTI